MEYFHSYVTYATTYVTRGVYYTFSYSIAVSFQIHIFYPNHMKTLNDVLHMMYAD